MKDLIRRAVALVATFALSIAVFAQDEDDAELVELPADIAALVEDLDQEKIDYLRGDGIYGYAGSH